jgi:integrase
MRDKLTATFAAKNNRPGRFADGGGLYLLVKPDGRKTWVFRWRDRITGKLRDRGLGPYGRHDVTLAKARVAAGECRGMVRENLDPIAEARQKRLDAKLAYAKRMTFQQCVDAYVEAHKTEWRNEKHITEWPSSLNRYAGLLLPLPVNEINTALIMKCLEPQWSTKTETMTRVRQRMEATLDWATARQFRTGKNPARWRGHLDMLLAAPNKLKNVQHLAALPYGDVGQFMAELHGKDSITAKAVEFGVLTACRPGEVVNAQWSEIDFQKKIWTIPAERMKAEKEHTVPLSPQAIKLLKSLTQVCDFIFPGRSLKKGLTTMSGLKLVKEMRGVTVHGFRSTFREWAGERTNFDRDVIEHALAHQLPDKVEASYMRKTQLPKRTKLMTAWADYCDVGGTK